MPEEPIAPDTVRCSWCSTESPAGTAICPSCHATLVATADGTVPGVTAIDPEAVLRSRSAGKSRGGILGFLSGDSGASSDVPTESELKSIAPPNSDVQIEMIRIELDAKRQRLDAEAHELQAELAIETADERGDMGAPSAAAALPASPPPGPAAADDAAAAVEEPPPGP